MLSPEGGSGEPMRFSLLVGRQGADEVLPHFVDEQLQHGEGQRRYSIMHEDIIPESEGHIEGSEEGDYEDEHDLSDKGEEHEGVGDSLRDDGQFAGLADKEIKDLSPDHSNEIASLGILASLSGEADGQVADGRDLLDVAGAPGDHLRVDCLPRHHLTVEHGVPEIVVSTIGAHPVHHVSIAILALGRTAGRVVLLQESIAEGDVIGIVDVSWVGVGHEDVGEGQEGGRREPEIVEDHEVAEHAAPKLHPALIAIGLRHQGQRHHVILLMSGLPGHQVELSRLIGQADSRDEISSNRDVQHDDCSEWTGYLQDDESDEGQHLAHLRGEGVADGFLDVVVDLPALLDPQYNRTEIVVEQDHVRCVLCHIGTSYTHRDTDIRLLDGWRVVHPVTSDSHYLSRTLASLDDHQFLGGSSPCEDYLALGQPLLQLLALL